MGMTFKKTDSLEKLFEEFAIDPDKKENKNAVNKNNQFSVDIKNSKIKVNQNKKED